MRVVYSPQFLRSFKNLPSDVQKVFRAKETVLRQNLFAPRLHAHKLKGRNDWAFLVTYKIRVIFIFRHEEVLLVNIGDHSMYRRR